MVTTTHDDFDFVVLSRVPGLEFQGEHHRYDPSLLYLAVSVFFRRYLIEGIAQI